MARIRYLKPDFFFDEKLAQISFENRLAFQGLWCHADKAGRLEASVLRLKALIFPYDSVDFQHSLDVLANNKFIEIYEINGKKYIQITNFIKHQKPHHTEQESTFPPPPRTEQKTTRRSITVKQRLRNGVTTVATQEGMGKGMEKGMGKGLEKKKDLTTFSAQNAEAQTSDPLIAQIQPKNKPPQTEFCEQFKLSYESMTGLPYVHKKEHFIIAARLINANGLDAVIDKAKMLGQLCKDQSVWFTREGWADFTIEKLSSMWNSIIPHKDKNESSLEDAIKKQEEHNERVSELLRR
jgi:hypothetical protein